MEFMALTSCQARFGKFVNTVVRFFVCTSCPVVFLVFMAR